MSPYVEIDGDVAFGRDCFVAANTILGADEDFMLSLGDKNTCQDNAYLMASGANLHFGNRVSIAHQAATSNSVVDDFTFFGFRCRMRDNTIGEGTMVMHNTTVEDNVTLRQRATEASEVVLREGTIVPEYAVIETREQADALPTC